MAGSTDSSRGFSVVTWIASGLLALLFVYAGAGKLFLAPEQVAENFARYGYSQGFALFIGVCELAGGLALLIPRLAGLAAAGLGVIMLGAVYTHLVTPPVSRVVIPLVALALLAVVLYARGLPRMGRSAAEAPAS